MTVVTMEVCLSNDGWSVTTISRPRTLYGVQMSQPRYNDAGGLRGTSVNVDLTF